MQTDGGPERVVWKELLMVTIEDVAKIDLKVAQVLEASDHPNADRLVVLKVDLGGEVRQLVAGLRGHYTNEELVGKKLVVVANLAPAVLRGVESNGMLLAAVDDDKVVILTPERDIALGSAVR